jgi:CelD/BcsL family acetyltransferase involved in cellulose biosynthesis
MHQLDPLQDPRWSRFSQSHPASSVFHSVAWLSTLRGTFGYEPVVFTHSPTSDTELIDGIVLCRVKSRLTGRRLVSLPFSDHCEPLSENATELFQWALDTDTNRSDSLETRPLHAVILPMENHAQDSWKYSFHLLDLQPDLPTLWAGLHTSLRRNVRRAQREGLAYQVGRSESLLDEFFRIHLVTRRRHRIPPLPKAWFRNLIESFGEQLQIRVASKDGKSVAAILTFIHKSTITYKYGGSDDVHRHLGGMHLLFWKTIEEAKAGGLEDFDLGRSDDAQQGLIAFKDRWGACLTYTRILPLGVPAPSPGRSRLNLKWMTTMAGHVVPFLPDIVFRKTGEILYRHFG